MDEAAYLLQSQENEMRNLIAQIGDPAAKYAAGIIDNDERIEQEARKRTYLIVLAGNEEGNVLMQEDIDAILEEKRIEAAMPTQEEINAADIAFLMMLGGED